MLSVELGFQLFEVHGAADALAHPRYGHLDRDTLEAMLQSAEALAGERFAPIAAALDETEPRMVAGRAVTAPALAPALRAYADAGFIAAGFPPEIGGLGLPTSVGTAVMAAFGSACTPAAGYVFLTAAAARVIEAFGSAAQRAQFLAPMLDGRWFGTMCLSEPHAGSSLLDAATQAIRMDDGRYRIRGDKMWISGGDHDAAENIVHLVLARIVEDGRRSDALSLFIVPRIRVDGTPNGVQLTGLNRKLGHHGTTNCALSFGGAAECLGELLGEPGRGLECMFHMMNEARIGVGTTAAATAWAAYRYSAGYALERMQGRRAADGAKARLVDHADVRRMLLTQKAIAEGGLSLCLFGACLVDRQRCATDDGTRRTTRDLLELLTPVIKAWCAERGVESNSLAIQVMGGAGYVRDHPVERLFRDQRLNPIHEGTNGILAIDLVVRKARRGAGLEPLLQAIDAEVAAALEDTAGCAAARCVAQHVAAASSTLRGVLATIAADKPPQAALAFATPIALMTGDLSVAWMWLKQTRAVAALDDIRAQAKRAAALHMVTHILPQSFGLAATVLSGAAAYDDLPPETFAEA